MTKRTKDPLPTAQREHLVVTTLDDETIIYDKRTHHATCLNAFAAKVWGLCDGRRTSADITNAMSVDDPEKDVQDALGKLSESGLLASDSDVSLSGRRGFLTGATAGLAAVTTLAVPPAAQAASGLFPATGDFFVESNCPDSSSRTNSIGTPIDIVYSGDCGAGRMKQGVNNAFCGGVQNGTIFWCIDA